MSGHSWLPSTAFAVACAAFSALAITTVWRNQGIHDRGPQLVTTGRPPNPRRKAASRPHQGDSSDIPDQPQTSQDHLLALDDLLHNAQALSQRIRLVQLTPESRHVITSLSGELSLVTTTLYRLQQILTSRSSKSWQHTGESVCFDTATAALTGIFSLIRADLESARTTSTTLLEVLRQLQDQRSALEFVLASGHDPMVPPTPPVEETIADSLAHHSSSLGLMAPFAPATGLTPGGDTRSWLEPPPEYSPPSSSLHEHALTSEKGEKMSNMPAPPQTQLEEADEVYDTDALYNAVTSNDIHLLDDLLALGADPNTAIGELRRNGTHQAAHLNHIACLTSLLRNGASMSVQDAKGDTALHLAAWAGHCDAVSVLLAHQADVDWLSGRDAYSPLWCTISASHIGAARLLLDQGASVSLRADGGLTPLHQAAVTGQSAMCELLLGRGAHVNARDESDNTPLHHAAACGSATSVGVLLRRGADVLASQAQGLTALHWAAHKGHSEVVILLLAFGAKVNARHEGDATPLHLAANRGHAPVIRILLEKGADSKLRATQWDGVRGTAAEIAEAKGHTRVADLLSDEAKGSVND